MKIAERIFHSSSIIKRGASVTALQRPCSGQNLPPNRPAATKLAAKRPCSGQTCRQIDLQPPDRPAAAKLAAGRPCSSRCGLQNGGGGLTAAIPPPPFSSAAIRPHDIAALQITISRESQDQISNSKDPAPLPPLQEPDLQQLQARSRALLNPTGWPLSHKYQRPDIHPHLLQTPNPPSS